MHSGALPVAPEILIRLFIFLLYALLSLFSYRLLMPDLVPTARRLAAFMLLAQVLTIAVAVDFRARLGLDEWLWDLNQDWNIPSAVASTQLALVGGVALLNAWRSKSAARLYLVAIGLVFLFLARDEYAAFHESYLGWERYYAALGAAVVVATLLVAVRSPRRAWKWHLCLLAGLAVSAAGALVIEQLRPQLQGPVCGNLGLLRLEGCLLTYEYEEALEFAGIWLALVAMLGQFSDLKPSPHPHARRLLYGLPVIWILWLIIDPFSHRQFLVQPDAIKFESQAQLHDFRIDSGEGTLVLQLHSSTRRRNHAALGYSIHLIDQVSGHSVAGRDAHWCCQQGAQGDALIFQQRLAIKIPSTIPVNRALWIVLTLWREGDGEFLRQKILSGNLQLLNDTQVVLGEWVLRADSPAASAAPLAAFDNGFALESVELPQSVQIGAMLSIPFTWRSETNGEEDLAQFLHFVHEASGEWWGYDQQPLGARLPTRLWYAGLADSETWRAPVPADLEPGRYAVFTGLYRARDLGRIPAKDAEGNPWQDGRALLGILSIAN